MGRGKRAAGTRSAAAGCADSILVVQGVERDFTVRIIRPGENYGQNRTAANDTGKDLVQFFDRKYRDRAGDLDGRTYGQRCGMYYLETLLGHAPNTPLSLDLGSPEWTIPADAMDRVIHFLRKHLPDPVRNRRSLLAE